MENLITLFKVLPTCRSERDIFFSLNTFFDNSNDGEKLLFKKYLDPNSVSNVGQATISLVNRLLEGKVRNDLSTNIIYSKKLNEVYDTLADRVLTGDAATTFLMTSMLNMPEAISNVFITILLKSPIGLSYKTVNKFYKKYYKGNFISIFEVQKANQYQRDKSYKPAFYYGTAKLDGLRCYYNRKLDNLFTRNNKPHNGFDEIREACKFICDKHNLAYIDGELYTDKHNFEKLNGVIRAYESSLKESVNFVVFAVIPNDTDTVLSSFTSTEMYNIMEAIDTYVLDLTNKVQMLKHIKISNNFEDISRYTVECVSRGFEGAMLRDPYIFYDFKRSNALLKVKLFTEDDFEIIDCFEGTGKYTGMLGGFFVRKGEVSSKVGTGFTDEERDFFWRTRDSLIGKIVNVKYMSLTDSGKSLRHPVFLKFK